MLVGWLEDKAGALDLLRVLHPRVNPPWWVQETVYHVGGDLDRVRGWTRTGRTGDDGLIYTRQLLMHPDGDNLGEVRSPRRTFRVQKITVLRDTPGVDRVMTRIRVGELLQ